MKAKKSLGQNFLKSEKALAQIIEAGELNKNDTVLEIGPGQGALTGRLIESWATVFAIEADPRMIEFLQNKFSDQINKKLFLTEADILEEDIESESWEKRLSPPSNSKSSNKKVSYKLIANIPYYITGAIIRKFLETKFQPERMVLLVQKEVAERIIARDKKESILSISVKAYCEPKMISVVKAGSFSPAPKVDSAIVLFNNISKDKFESRKISEKDFFMILNAGFAHKRKILIKNLEKVSNDKLLLKNIFEELKINLKERAENISTEQWFSVVKKISDHKN